MKNFNLLTCLSLSLIFVGCEGGDFKESKTFVEGKVVTADTLNLGQRTYVEYCIQCHGVKGDGNGVSAKGMFPPPRNFTLGIYKFGNVASGELLHDEDFYRIIRGGLKGTAMLPWDISDKRLDAVTQYIKTFAPKTWENKEAKLGEAIQATPNPFHEKKEYAIEYGKEVYHAVANCNSCHSAYATKDELSAYSKKYKQDMPEIGADFYTVKLQDGEHGSKNIPVDFTWHEVRTAATVEELYVRIASGIGGTSMPSWKGVIDDEQLWAVSYYVKSLMELKDTPARAELFNKLKTE